MDYLKHNLSENRFKHTLAVAEECDRMAELFCLPPQEKHILHTAALLHDITKEKTPDEQISLCRVYRIEYTDSELSAPALFHAKTGAYFAKDLFPELCCDRVSDIIFAHTTGKENMTLLQKLLLLADATEQTRKHKNLIELREYFYNIPDFLDLTVHLDRAVIKYLDMTLSYLISQGQPIDTQTVKARNYLVLKTR